VGSGKWVKSFLKMAPNNRWILLSGTPGDTWMDYAPVFIANGHFKNRSQFLQEHVVFARYSKFPKVERYVGIDKLERLRADILVHMPMDRHTTRLTHFIPVKFDEDRLRVVTRDRWNEFKDRPIESLPEFFYLMRKVVNSHASRLSAVRALMKMHPRLVVFYNFDYELEALRTLEDEGVAMAEWNGHKHETIPETDKWLYFVQYTAGSEGWNCTETDATVFYSLTYSYRQWYPVPPLLCVALGGQDRSGDQRRLESETQLQRKCILTRTGEKEATDEGAYRGRHYLGTTQKCRLSLPSPPNPFGPKLGCSGDAVIQSDLVHVHQFGRID
jgi:hypothetical protein